LAPPGALDPVAKPPTREEALRWRRALSGPLVFTNGVFDLIHRGHVADLAAARGGRVVRVPLEEGPSTTTLIEMAERGET
jgi:bifunctional ADP-heptose synthase (sugar kinase/adenylyltransferase)